ncbi:MAG TPA: sugar phosphate isomerase/epimerase [Polyangia bacterium]|nr:sugar phosphate isomerase/epimerase [Polyangia bacterium]
MDYTRREFGKLALAGLPAAALLETPLFGAGLVQAKPNSLINGVQIGTITYSYRSMPDQSAEATLKYILDSGISAIELMGGPAESYAQAQTGFKAPERGRGAGGGAAGRGPGGPGRGGAGAAAAEAGAAAAAPQAAPVDMSRSWNGQPCAAGRGGGGAPAPAGAEAAAGAAAAGARAGGGGGGRGRAELTPEQQAAADALKKWRTSVSMDPFKKLRKMYNDAGVTIYAWKQLNANMSDEEFEYIFNVAEALGCTHTTLELPAGPNAAAELKRIGDFAMKKKIYAAYHTHLQGSMTAFDQAFALSKGNMANVDLGHFVAGGNVGGTPVQFLEKFHDRISSFHLKDRTLPEHCSLNLAWGTGETPIKAILQTVQKNKWKIPASIELEYAIPADSDAVKETKKCVQFCRDSLA